VVSAFVLLSILVYTLQPLTPFSVEKLFLASSLSQIMFKKVSWGIPGEEDDSTKGCPMVEITETIKHETEFDEVEVGPLDGECSNEKPIARFSIGNGDGHRKSSVVSFEMRRPSIIPGFVASEHRGSIRSQRFSTGQLKTDNRVRSIYSIPSAQGSTETDIASLHEEELPQPVQSLLEEQAPGTYKLTIEETNKGPPGDERTAVNVTISPLEFADKIAQAQFLEEYTKAYPLPDIENSLLLSKLRYRFFTVYRRLFAIVFTANLVAIAILASRSASGVSYHQAAIGIGSNIFTAVLARHDILVNAVISVVHLVPKSWPLSIRKRIGKIYCHAGIHSGCGVSAAVWYIYFIVLLALQPLEGSEGIRAGLYLTTALIFTSLLSMIALSHPIIRSRYHDIWEHSHRYIGWFLTSAIWAQVFLFCAASSPDRSFGSSVLRSPLFWMVLGVTCLLIYPWAVMRKRKLLPTDYRATPYGLSLIIVGQGLVTLFV
jgi:hypothetical protein